MLRPSQTLSGSAWLAFPLIAGILIFVSACASKTAADEADPQIAPSPSTDTISVFAGTSQEVQKRPEESIQTVLQARTSGATVLVSPSGALSVRIHGAGSFYSGTQPLYVVDGTPVQPGPGGFLVGLNPYDVATIRVLKGPPETTIYGARGANGVVVITTKRPGT